MEGENCSVSHGNSIIKGISNFKLLTREIEDLLNLLRSNADPETLTRYIDFLKQLADKRDLIEDEKEKITNIIKECISFSLSYIEDSKKFSSEENEIRLELYCMLSLTVLNLLNDNDIEYNSIAFTFMSKCPKMVRLFNCQRHYEKGEYYVVKCKELTETIIDKYKHSDVFVTKILMDKKISVDLYHIETISNRGKLDESFDEIQKVKSRLSDFPDHREYFINICYNVSIKFYKKERYEHSITLLETALKIATDVNPSCESISIIAKLLTHIYTKQSIATNWQKCLKIFNLIKEKDVPIAFFPDLFTAAFFSGNQNTIADILSHYHKSGDFSTCFISEVVEKLNGKGYYKIAIDFIHKERQRRLELKEKFYLFSLELQVHLKTSSLEKASALLEDAIRLAKSTDVTLKQTNSFCKVLFSYADRLFKSQSFMQSLTWYKKFLKFVETTRISGAAITFLKKRICLCYLEMSEGQLAKQMFMKIECPNSNTDFLHLYLGLQIAIMCEDQELADIALKYTGGYDHSLEEVLLACCRKALSIGKTAFICKILELLIEKFNVNEGSLSHLKLSEILIKLYLGSTEMMEEQEKIIICLRKALEISEHVEKGNATEDMMEWFCRVAWNMALKEGTKVGNVFEFFYICCQFLEKLKGSYVRLKNALIFVIAAGIQTLRENGKSEGMEEESKDISRKTLSSIDICRNIEKDNTRILSLLYVYEFETRLLMEDPSAESILRRMWQMPFVDAEALQLVASIAYEDS
ncbi:Testis-expressed protein 11 like protein [Argiope bruennichi]|uniref:Testis-expressed protein 11 like protein n=1 Tax=Argiope bruennichi TaxID=94029 RepID=A0A8T0FEU2_ARGBR|nr:Testis-expressed protein 11 like protein [Argiope bruennichi]